MRAAATLSVLLLGAAAGCGTESLDLTGARISLRRDPAGLHAAGFRPHTVEVQADGSFTFTCIGADGLERTERGTIPVAELEGLLMDALSLDFFELGDAYSMGFSDMITETLEVRVGAREKRVSNYWLPETRETLAELVSARELANYDVHRGLSDLAARIDAAVRTREILARLVAAEPR